MQHMMKIMKMYKNNAEIDEAKDRLTETDFTCQDMIEDANYFGMDMEITRVGDTYIM